MMPTERPRCRRFAAHTFASLADADFDAAAYSRMKFGSHLAAKLLGTNLADRFFARHRDALNDRCVVIPAPSTTVPVAATLLSHHFMNRVNAKLVAEGALPLEWTLAHRDVTYNNDYADQPKAIRRQLLKADRIYLNRAFVAGKTLLFVDDCRITGAHEAKLTDFLRAEGVENRRLFVCFAAYTGDDPSVETRLNHAAIRSAEDLIELAREPGHQVTTRAVRLILGVSVGQLRTLLATAPAAFVEGVFHAALTKRYHLHYPETFAALADMTFGLSPSEGSASGARSGRESGSCTQPAES